MSMKPENETPSKDKIYWKLLNNAIELDVKKGHLKWTLSDLSRKSDITRSLIYYYFGKEKEMILQEAVKLVGENLVGLTEERTQLWKEGRFEESLLQARELIEKAPFLTIFILANRGKSNTTGESLRTIETQFIAKLKAFFPKCSKDQITGLFSIFWGLALSPHSDGPSIREVTRLIKKIYPSHS